MQVKAISACPDTDSATVGGDSAEVFSRLYAEHFADVRRYLAGRTRDWHLADELAQETFVTLWARLVAGTVSLPDQENEFGFLARRAKWVLGTHYRTMQRHPDHPLRNGDVPLETVAVAIDPGSPSDVELVEARLHAGQIIADLPAPQRQVLALHLLEDLSLPQVAAHVGLSVRRTRERVAEGLRQLRAGMGVEQDVPDRDWAGLREQALRLYLESAQAGRPLSMKAVARRLGVSPAWVEKVMREHQGPATRPASARTAVLAELRAEILAGAWVPETPLPAGAALAPRWETSARTVTWVLNALTAEGLLIRDMRQRFVVAASPVRIPAPRRSPENVAAALVLA